MPRSSAASKKNNSHRHDTGALVGPGTKKVTKQKSTGHLNGGPAGAKIASASSSSSVASPFSSTVRSSSDTTVIPSSSDLDGSANDLRSEGNGGGCVNGYTKGNFDMLPPSNGGDGFLSPRNGCNGGGGGGTPFLSSRRSSEKSTVGGSAASLSSKKSSGSASVNPIHLASTVLRSCPMYDTIAILIFLLQLPPMVLTCVQFLFASLTFLPPSGASAGSLTSNFDIFQGPAGTPSLSTMIAVDGFCVFFWGLFMWTWAQNFALDLAHVQVAITLGGGSSGKNGGVNMLCVAIVLVLHLIRSRGIQEFVFGHLMSAKFVTPDWLSQYSHLIPAELRATESQTSPSWIRSLLAIHILAQAGTAMARRSMAKNRSPAPSRFGKRADTEASAGSQTQADSAFESGASVSSYWAADGAPSGSGSKDLGRERWTSAKRRRRQANQVRSRQPFWAALANMKITIMREYEHSKALSKTARGLPMTEDDLQGIKLDDGLIWITHVDSSSIKFAAADLGDGEDSTPSTSICENARLEVDGVAPFYVCVNGALWATATIGKVQDTPKGSNAVQWRGEISGLAPNCAYTCSFLRTDTDDEICAMSVRTPAATDSEQGNCPSYRII